MQILCGRTSTVDNVDECIVYRWRCWHRALDITKYKKDKTESPKWKSQHVPQCKWNAMIFSIK